MEWPEDLPKSPLLRNFSRQRRQNKREFSPDGGRSTYVRFYSDVPDVLSVEFLFNKNQLSIFRDFYKNSTNFGIDRFNFNDPIENEVVEARFVGDVPDESAITHNLFRVSFELEII